MENVAMNAGRPASATSGRSYCAPLSKSELLSWLRSDCQASSRRIDLIVLHCSDTRADQHYTIEMLKRDHKRRNFGAYPGYHIYIRRDGTAYYCRPVSMKGCHAGGKYNPTSIALCYEGGHGSATPKYVDTRTPEQRELLHEALCLLHEIYPNARICGHRDLAARACPCFDAKSEYAYIMAL